MPYKRFFSLCTLTLLVSFVSTQVSADELEINTLKLKARASVRELDTATQSFQYNRTINSVKAALPTSAVLRSIVRRINNDLGADASQDQAIDAGLFASDLLRCSTNAKREKRISSPIRLSALEARHLLETRALRGRKAGARSVRYVQRGIVLNNAEDVKALLSRRLTRLERRLENPELRGERRANTLRRAEDLRLRRRAIDEGITALLTASGAVCGS